MWTLFLRRPNLFWRWADASCATDPYSQDYFKITFFFTFTIYSLKISLFLCPMGHRNLCAKGPHCCLLLKIIVFIFWKQTDFANLVANLVVFGTHKKLWLWKSVRRCFLEGFLENEDGVRRGVTFCRGWVIEIAEAKSGLVLPAHSSFMSHLPFANVTVAIPLWHRKPAALPSRMNRRPLALIKILTGLQY